MQDKPTRKSMLEIQRAVLKSTSVSVRLTPMLRAKLEINAKRYKVTLGEFIRQILERGM